MRFIEAKLGAAFPNLVEAEILVPLGIDQASFAYSEENFVNVVLSVDEETGAFRSDRGYHCLQVPNSCPEDGAYSVARDMTMNVESLAAFLIAAVNGDGYDAAMAADRNTVHAVKDRAAYFCEEPGVTDARWSKGTALAGKCSTMATPNCSAMAGMMIPF